MPKLRGTGPRAGGRTPRCPTAFGATPRHRRTNRPTSTSPSTPPTVVLTWSRVRPRRNQPGPPTAGPRGRTRRRCRGVAPRQRGDSRPAGRDRTLRRGGGGTRSARGRARGRRRSCGPRDPSLLVSDVERRQSATQAAADAGPSLRVVALGAGRRCVVDTRPPPERRRGLSPVGPDDVFLINSTSGTTGMPKCVVHTQNRWHYFHQKAVANGELTADDVFLPVIPTPFGFGIWTSHTTPIHLGATTVRIERFDRRRDVRGDRAAPGDGVVLRQYAVGDDPGRPGIAGVRPQQPAGRLHRRRAAAVHAGRRGSRS